MMPLYGIGFKYLQGSFIMVSLWRRSILPEGLYHTKRQTIPAEDAQRMFLRDNAAEIQTAISTFTRATRLFDSGVVSMIAVDP